MEDSKLMVQGSSRCYFELRLLGAARYIMQQAMYLPCRGSHLHDYVEAATMNTRKKGNIIQHASMREIHLNPQFIISIDWSSMITTIWM